MGIVQRTRRISLATKFSLMSIGLILITSLGICLFVIRTEMTAYYQELLNHGITIADSASKHCEFGIYTEDRKSLHAVIQGLSANADIAYVSVLDREGRVLAEGLFRPSFAVPASPFKDGEQATKVRHRDVVSGSGGEWYLDIHFPVASSRSGIQDALLQGAGGRQEQQVIGYFRVGLSQESLQRKLRQVLVPTIFFATVLVVIGSLLSIMASKRIASPLERLQAATQQFAQGNFDSAIEIKTTDEIADLARTFDDMRHRLRDSHSRLKHDALHDSLTGLPNRALFVERLQHAIKLAKRRPDYLFGVLFIDLDGFKTINDSLGHTIGDLLLVEFSRKLLACVRPLDAVARLGGDEFAILVEDISGEGNALYVATRIKEVLQQPFSLNGREVYVTGSMGIALSSGGYELPEQVLRDADTAMYQAKAHSRSNFVVFEPAMHARAVERLHLEIALRQAIDRREFITYYQPILSVGPKRIVGLEALARWQHPERGLVPPGSFIPLAEETGLIVAIDRLILREACSQMKRWLDLVPGNDLRFISVNLSHKQIKQPDLVDHVAGVLAETGLRAEHLKLEITENVLFENPEAASTLLMRLRDLGVQLYIDDFGTGYSSLSYLHRLPINGLKIDRSFIMRIGEAGENSSIVKTIMTLARDMNIDAVAEGVETTGQLEHIASLNCTYWQGYLYSKPIRSDEVQALLMA